MNYLSVCSGVEAASVAWKPLGWKAVGFSEIEPFPSAVLKHHYPEVPNYGDMTKFEEWNINEPVELLVGGTPCQSFSIAGLRKGLADERGNLALVYCQMLAKYQPKWFIWENVPGVLSSGEGRDFGSFLGAVAELGYGFAYRVLDAQYFGVAQRRKRVFVVGHLGDWRAPFEVLALTEGMSGHPKPSREERERVTSFAPSSFGGYSEGVGTLRQSGGDLGGGSETLIASRMVGFGDYTIDGTASTLKARDYKDATDLITVTEAVGCDVYNQTVTGDIAVTLTEACGGTNTSGPKVLEKTYVRRLSPIEAERLQGFPDNYTLIPWKKAQSPDSQRYKAMGNSMAVPVMNWIGSRINDLEEVA